MLLVRVGDVHCRMRGQRARAGWECACHARSREKPGAPLLRLVCQQVGALMPAVRRGLLGRGVHEHGPEGHMHTERACVQELLGAGAGLAAGIKPGALSQHRMTNN